MPPRHAKTIFCNSGFEAVEAALKTALLATDKPGVIAFEGAYHGLGYGALNTTHRAMFHKPFRKQLGKFSHFAQFPSQKPPAPRPSRIWKSYFKNIPSAPCSWNPFRAEPVCGCRRYGFWAI